MNSQKMPLKNSLCLLLAATIWGIAFVAQSVGMEYVGPFTFNGVRSLIGAAVLVPVLFILNRSGNKSSAATDSAIPESSSTLSEKAVSATPYNSRDLWLGGIACGSALFAASSFQQFGIQYTTVGKAGFITACYIVIVPIIGIFLKKKCSPLYGQPLSWHWSDFIFSASQTDFSIGLGDILMLVCAFLFSLHILVIDYFSPKADGVKLSCIQFLVCGILSMIPALILEHPQISSILTAWLPILYAGVMSCGVAYTLQVVGQKNVNPTVASLILSLESCISVLAGWVLLDQKLSIKDAPWMCHHVC